MQFHCSRNVKINSDDGGLILVRFCFLELLSAKLFLIAVKKFIGFHLKAKKIFLKTVLFFIHLHYVCVFCFRFIFYCGLFLAFLKIRL